MGRRQSSAAAVSALRSPVRAVVRGAAVADVSIFIAAPKLSYNSGTSTLTVELDVMTQAYDLVNLYWTGAAVSTNTPDAVIEIQPDDVIAGVFSYPLVLSGGTYTVGAIQQRGTAYSNPASPTVSITVAASFQYVGRKSVTFTGTTAFTIPTTALDAGATGVGGDVQAGDFCVLVYGAASGGDIALAPSNTTAFPFVETTLSSTLTEAFADDTQDANLAMATCVAVGTPDATVSVTGNTSATGANIAHLMVWRSCSGLDGVPQVATGIDGATANPPAITPTTAGARVVAVWCGALPDGNSGDYAAAPPSGWDDFQASKASGGSTRDLILATASQAWTSGAVDPPAINPGAASVASSWAAITFAVKP